MIVQLIVCSLVAQSPVKLEEKLGTPWWKLRHEACVELTRQGGHELIFIGDSITQGWESRGKETWDKFYTPRKAANFGFSGDRVEHVLWRMANGEIIGLQPKVAVIMIGTNGITPTNANTETVVSGITSMVSILRKEMPKTKILLLGVFPRGQSATDPIRLNVSKTNDQLIPMADNKHVFFLDVGKVYLSRSGEMWRGLMPDLLHPSDAGYTLWAKVMESKLVELLGE